MFRRVLNSSSSKFGGERVSSPISGALSQLSMLQLYKRTMKTSTRSLGHPQAAAVATTDPSAFQQPPLTHTSSTHPKAVETNPLSKAIEDGKLTLKQIQGNFGAAKLENLVNMKDGAGLAPLHVACREGRGDVALFLLKNRAVVNAADRDGRTPLHYAAMGDHDSIVNLLVQGKAAPQYINLKDVDGATPLHLAAENDCKKSTRALLNAPTHARLQLNQMLKECNFTALHLAVINDCEQVVKLLIGHPDTNPNIPDNQGWTPLHRAAEIGSSKCIRELCQSRKTDINPGDDNMWVPLFVAANAGHSEACKALAKYKCNVNARTSSGQTALYTASQLGHESVVQVLLKDGQADPRITDNLGSSPMGMALTEGHKNISQLLDQATRKLPKTIDHQAGLNDEEFGAMTRRGNNVSSVFGDVNDNVNGGMSWVSRGGDGAKKKKITYNDPDALEIIDRVKGTLFFANQNDAKKLSADGQTYKLSREILSSKSNLSVVQFDGRKVGTMDTDNANIILRLWAELTFETDAKDHFFATVTPTGKLKKAARTHRDEKTVYDIDDLSKNFSKKDSILAEDQDHVAVDIDLWTVGKKAHILRLALKEAKDSSEIISLRSMEDDENQASEVNLTMLHSTEVENLQGEMFSSLETDHGELEPVKPSSKFKGDLFPYQEYGLAWMLRREELRRIPGLEDQDSSGRKRKGSVDVGAAQMLRVADYDKKDAQAATTSQMIEHVFDSEKVGSFFWERVAPATAAKSVKDKHKKFRNMLTGNLVESHPCLPRGGVLADDMGLGKTVQLLALMSYRSATNDEEPLDSNSKSPKPKGADVDTRTLIVCPLTLMVHWEVHIQKYLPSFRVCVLHQSRGQREELKEKDMKTANVVITTYDMVRAEHRKLRQLKDSYNASKALKNSLFTMNFDRVLLDEAHKIKNSKGQAAKACAAIKSDVRWAVTGTPIQNKMDEFHSLVQFLQVNPFREADLWSKLIIRPLKQGDLKATARLTAVLKLLILRRCKGDMFQGKPLVQLPPITRQRRHVAFNAVERDAYDQLKTNASLEFNQLMMNKKLQISSALVLLMRLRQFCGDPRLLVDVEKMSSNLEKSGELKKIGNRTERENLIASILSASDQHCPSCLEPLSRENITITQCHHLCCTDCAQELVKDGKGKCSVCESPFKALLRTNDLPLDSLSTMTIGGGGGHITGQEQKKKLEFGPKIRELLKIITKEHPDEKIVVFSQWRTMLDVIQSALKDHGVGYCRLDGTMDIRQRAEQLRKFDILPSTGEDPNKDPNRVMLLSMMAGGTGLNLVVSSVVVLMDPWWNPSIDEQAVMRVHRIGQKRPVKVVQMTVKKTVEDGILALQEKKKLLVDSTVGWEQSILANAGKDFQGKEDKVKIDMQQLAEFFK